MSKNIIKNKSVIYTIIAILFIILLLFIRFPKTIDTIKLNYKTENLNFITDNSTQIETTSDIKLSYDQGKGYSYYDKTKKVNVINDILPASATKETALFNIYQKGNTSYPSNFNTINIGLDKLKLTLPNIDGNFELYDIVFFNNGKEVAKLTSQELYSILKPTNVDIELKDDNIKFNNITENSYVEFDVSFNSIFQKNISYFGIPNIFLILVVIFVYLFICHRNKFYSLFEKITIS